MLPETYKVADEIYRTYKRDETETLEIIVFNMNPFSVTLIFKSGNKCTISGLLAERIKEEYKREMKKLLKD